MDMQIFYISSTFTKPPFFLFVFFFNDTATTEIYTLSLHDALPIARHIRRTASWSGDDDGRSRRRTRDVHGSARRPAWETAHPLDVPAAPALRRAVPVEPAVRGRAADHLDRARTGVAAGRPARPGHRPHGSEFPRHPRRWPGD